MFEEDTVWTWNAIGKRRGTWGLSSDANESQQGFITNHLIADQLAETDSNENQQLSNSDPITGQAAWYDTWVNVEPLGKQCAKDCSAEFSSIKPFPNQEGIPAVAAYTTHRNVNLKRSWKDILRRGKC